MSPLRLEVFEGQADAPDHAVMADSGYLEDLKLAAYEQGYSAGWEDASSSDESDLRTRQLAAARNLQALAFTHHEARGLLLRALAPVIRSMTDTILPEIARAALGAVVLEEVTKAAGQALDAPLTLHVHPESRALVEPMLQATTGLSVLLLDEPSLPPEQVLLRAAPEERLIDLADSVARIRAAVDDFFQTPPTGDQG